MAQKSNSGDGGRSEGPLCFPDGVLSLSYPYSYYQNHHHYYYHHHHHQASLTSSSLPIFLSLFSLFTPSHPISIRTLIFSSLPFPSFLISYLPFPSLPFILLLPLLLLFFFLLLLILFFVFSSSFHFPSSYPPVFLPL